MSVGQIVSRGSTHTSTWPHAKHFSPILMPSLLHVLTASILEVLCSTGEEALATRLPNTVQYSCTYTCDMQPLDSTP